MRPSFLTTFGMATDQGGKLGLGKNRTLICMYSTFQVGLHSTVVSKCAVLVFDVHHILQVYFLIQSQQFIM